MRRLISEDIALAAIMHATTEVQRKNIRLSFCEAYEVGDSIVIVTFSSSFAKTFSRSSAKMFVSFVVTAGDKSLPPIMRHESRTAFLTWLREFQNEAN